MATTNGNRKILDLKRWEMVAPAPVITGAGAFVASSRHYKQQQLYVNSNTSAFLYNPNEDGWVALPSPALAGTFGAGACGVASSWSTGSAITAATLGVTSGTTNSIVTNQTLVRDLRGYSVHIVSGPNAGETKVIASNSLGTNATINFTTASASAFSNLNTFRLLTPRWYVLGAGTLATGSFRVYDYATNTWTTLSQTGLAGTWGIDAKLISTPSWVDDGYVSFATGTATAGAASTLTNSAKNWTPNQWSNYQIRIVSGTGAGQIRSIASNTATVITVGTAWTTAPDATSVYSIEGNDDFLYLIGNNTTTMYRYSITANTWTTLSPTTARLVAMGAGGSAHWVYGATDSAWTAENTIINGRRIYSFRGAGNSQVDYYDIALNAWVNDINYAPKTDTVSTGSKYTYNGDFIYIQKEATGRYLRFNLITSELDGWGISTYPQSTTVVGDTMFDVIYHDGATEIVYIYTILNTSTVMLRMMVI
jgi:hypothetical protein